MPPMSTPNQGSRVIPLSTKVTAAEKEMVDSVARDLDTTAAELIRELVLPVVRILQRRKEAA